MSSGDRSVATVIPIATAKDIRTLQRLKPPLVMKSPPTRTNQKNVLITVVVAIGLLLR